MADDEALKHQSVQIAGEKNGSDSDRTSSGNSDHGEKPEKKTKKKLKWSLGILEDNKTEEVPGSILLLPKVNQRNEPLGYDYTHHESQSDTASEYSRSSYPAQSTAMFGAHTPPRTPQTPKAPKSGKTPQPETPMSPPHEEKKRTGDGEIILEPQPDDSMNDPLNWSPWRRDSALVVLGIYCFLGGGMTPVLAAGYTEVAATFGVPETKVALTTGLYMMGLGLGSVVASPTAILFGKRPVYLVGSILFSLTAIWCAASPSFDSLIVARIFMGLAVSPVECLPSATIAEIFFLHERAYRLGVYTLLLLGGKNLIPLASAAIIQTLSWRWVFWVVAIIVGGWFFFLFIFVPETFWDRTPIPHKPRRRPWSIRRLSSYGGAPTDNTKTLPAESQGEEQDTITPVVVIKGDLAQRREKKQTRFESADHTSDEKQNNNEEPAELQNTAEPVDSQETPPDFVKARETPISPPLEGLNIRDTGLKDLEEKPVEDKSVPTLKQLRSGSLQKLEDYFGPGSPSAVVTSPALHPVKSRESSIISTSAPQSPWSYTRHYRSGPPKTYLDTLKPWSGRLSNSNWLRVAVRPFILYTYPGILWSAAVYSLSVGWLIVLSESVDVVFGSGTAYNFTPLQIGLVYLSPFIGGVLGTVVAGKVSDIIVRWMARRNGGVYEPEFRLVMGIPVAITTTIGLMGFGWSGQDDDPWIAPTIFFGVISFGCTLGSTTAITFAVDSYRQFAGEALVTLNFSKNILHGLVFSLFIETWLGDSGTKKVFLVLGGIQLFFLLWTIPLYIFGKRFRMWTVRQRFMEKW